jgi:beta-glucosidase
MVPYRYELFVKDLISLVKKEEIPMERIDDAVERILRVKFIAGLFEFPFTDRSLLDTIGCMVTFAVFSTWCIGILACF